MKKLYLVVWGILSCVLLSCSGSENGKSLPNPPKHIVLVGFDGLSSYSLNNGAEMPQFRSMMQDGCYTLENRSVLPSSSAVNWASMFMGAGPELHGYTEWGSSTPDLPSRVLNEHGIFPDIYSGIRAKYPDAELGFFYEWNGMKYLVDTLAINHVQPLNLSAENSKEELKDVLSYLKEKKPMFCSVIFGEPDGAGHSKGWESEDYFKMLTHLDQALALIVSAVKEAGMMDETVFIFSADHGGKGTGHGGKTMNEMQTPIVFYGKGIKQGAQITESTMVYDIAGTVAFMLGVEQPQVWIARPIKSAFNEKF